MSGYLGRFPHLEAARHYCRHLQFWPEGDDGPEEYGCRIDHPEVEDGCDGCEYETGE